VKVAVLGKEHKLLGKRTSWCVSMSQSILRQPQHFQPFDLLFLPERCLDGAVLRLKSLQEVKALEVLLVGLIGDLELGEWRIVKLDYVDMSSRQPAC
jgi:hypothetical protein